MEKVTGVLEEDGAKTMNIEVSELTWWRIRLLSPTETPADAIERWVRDMASDPFDLDEEDILALLKEFGGERDGSGGKVREQA